MISNRAKSDGTAASVLSHMHFWWGVAGAAQARMCVNSSETRSYARRFGDRSCFESIITTRNRFRNLDGTRLCLLVQTLKFSWQFSSLRCDSTSLDDTALTPNLKMFFNCLIRKLTKVGGSPFQRSPCSYVHLLDLQYNTAKFHVTHVAFNQGIIDK